MDHNTCSRLAPIAAGLLIGMAAFGAEARTHWRDPTQAYSAGLINSAVPVLEVSLRYDSTQNPSFHLRGVTSNRGYFTRVPKDESTHFLILKSADGRTLSETPFVISTEIFAAPHHPGEKHAEHGHSKKLRQQSVQINVAWASDAKRIEIQTRGGQVLLQEELVSPAQPGKKIPTGFRSALGSEILSGLQSAGIRDNHGWSVAGLAERATELFTRISGVFFQDAVAVAEDPLKLDIAVLGDRYRSEAEFLADVDRIMGSFLAMEPYRSRADSIVIHALNAGDLSCTHDAYNSRLLICSSDRTYRAISRAGIPSEAVLVISNEPGYGGSGMYGGMAVTYNGESAGYVGPHELGHSFGFLLDEYASWYGDLESYLFGSATQPNKNCFRGSDPQTAWPAIGKFDANWGCGSNSFTPSQGGLMGSTGDRGYFNEPSQRLLLSRIEQYTGPVSDTVPPTCRIESPREGASVRRDYFVPSVSGFDNLGLSRYEISVDGVFLQSIYSGSQPAHNNIRLSTFAPGPHQLSVRARDLSGNVADCGSVSINLINPTDTVPPTVRALFFQSSPGSTTGVQNPTSTLSGTFQVRAAVSDDQAVASVLFKSGDLTLARADQYPYIGFIRSTLLSNGENVITATVLDYAGNSGELSVAVQISNATPSPTPSPKFAPAPSPSPAPKGKGSGGGKSDGPKR